MNHEAFNAQARRLEEEWPNGFGPEKKHILWNIFRTQTVECMDFAITHAIKNARGAPTISNIESGIIEWRKTQYSKQRGNFKRDAAHFFSGTYHTDEQKMIVGTIKRRVRGEIPDHEWASFMADLDRVAGKSKQS